MENLAVGLWYRVNLDNPHGKVPIVDVQKLADCLPHGSGIDGDWNIIIKRSGDVLVHGDYHAMDENGSYDGWRHFRFTLERARKMISHDLIGPCAGKTQITVRPGDINLVRWVGGGDASDYLYETCEYAISQAGLLTNRSEVITK